MSDVLPKKRSKPYKFKGLLILQWSDELGVNRSEVHKRFYYHLRMGLTPQEALQVTVEQLSPKE